ncbi:MAG: ArsR/SmtB family transcription factor [Beijerinckiaceae bacterium]
MSDHSEIHSRADEVARTLSALANPRRLQILCHLISAGETNVTGLAGPSGLSQSALSQHLKLMRAEGLVRSRKAGLNVFYAIADQRVADLVASLERIYCAER